MCENTHVLTDASLKDYTTFGIGGRAERLVLTDEISVFQRELPEASLIMGGGSNLLVGDGGIKGTVVCFRSNLVSPRILSDGQNEVVLFASAAARLCSLSRFAAASGLSGLEWAAGIPGTVGGAVKMNAGAHGGDVKSRLVFAEIFDGVRTEKKSADELKLGYRESDFCGAVVGAAFSLSRSGEQAVTAKTRELLRARRKAQPTLRSAGSVYKAVDGAPAYKFIAATGLSGYKIGGARVSEKHANFIVNEGGATARDVLALMEKIESEVYARFGVRLSREVMTVGEF